MNAGRALVAAAVVALAFGGAYLVSASAGSTQATPDPVRELPTTAPAVALPPGDPGALPPLARAPRPAPAKPAPSGPSRGPAPGPAPAPAPAPGPAPVAPPVPPPTGGGGGGGGGGEIIEG